MAGLAEVERLAAIGLYKARASRVKELIDELLKEYEEHLAPIEEVRDTLTRELKGKGKLSDLIVRLREEEAH